MWSLFQRIFFNPRMASVVIILLSKAAKKYMESENVDSPKMQPLGLPLGSVRAILVIILTVIVGASFFLPEYAGNIPTSVFDVWLVGLGYYIGYRSTNNRVQEDTI